MSSVANELGGEESISPLIKWPGGKRALIGHLKRKAPSTFNRYFEPFFGGGALFFFIRPAVATLSDKNEELVNCYLQVRDHPEELIKRLRSLKNSEQDYYNVRDWIPRTELLRAARFIYLTTLSFNGIYRVNLKGIFNVPYGYKTHLATCDETRIRSISRALQRVTLRCLDFEITLKSATKGDLVYLDPPYTVAHGHNGFLKYNEKIFSWDDQVRLARVAKKLADAGCHVIISNADHSSIRELYSDFELTTIDRPSIIAADSSHRRTISECIFVGGSDATQHKYSE